MNNNIKKEELLEKMIQDIKLGKLTPDVFSNDKELRELSNLAKSLIESSKNIAPSEEGLRAIISSIKTSVTNKSDASYNNGRVEGRSSNPGTWDLILNFMNKTKILIPAGLVILVLIITGINTSKSEDILVLNKEFQSVDKLDSDFSTAVDQEIDDNDISTYLSSNSSVENYQEQINIESDSAEINSIESGFDSLINDENQTNSISSSF